MSPSFSERILALGGLFQAAHLVQRIARTGIADSSAMEKSLYSIFMIDAATTEDVYDGRSGILYGLRQLVRIFESPAQPQDMEVTRYVISLIQLERQLSRRKELLANIAREIEQANWLRQETTLLDMVVINRLSGIYENNISQLTPRIMVQGEPLHLKNPDNARRIRALLLAGIRSAVLWRQKGGGRWQLLFGRKQILQAANKLLQAH